MQVGHGGACAPTFGQRPTRIDDLGVGDMLSRDEVGFLFGDKVARDGGGWSSCGRVYVSDGAHLCGRAGWRVSEVRGARAPWNF